MKTLIFFTLLLLGIPAMAVDVPEGGDAIYHQVRNANAVVFATLTSSDKSFLYFNLLKGLNRKMPATFKIGRALAPGHDQLVLKNTATYLLFLKVNRLSERLGIYSLAMGEYSVSPMNRKFMNDYESVISDYMKFRGNNAALAKSLMLHVDKRIPYLQYSAVKDMAMRGMLDETASTELAEKMRNGIIVDPRAKLEIVRKISKFKMTTYTPILEQLIVDNSENVSVKSASLTALDHMGQVEALRRVAPAMLEHRSGRLRRVTIDIVKPRN